MRPFELPKRAASVYRKAMTLITDDLPFETVTIDHLGHKADGVALTPSGPLYVSRTLAGETVRVAREGERGRLVDVVIPSADRIEPLCRHFGTCGSCSLQMMAPAAYLAWKREIVVAALESRGLLAEVLPVVPVSGRSRRRAVFAARREGKDIHLGFRERLAHTVVEIEACEIIRPALLAALPALRRLVQPLNLPKKGATLTVIETETGLDVALAEVEADTGVKAKLIREAVAGGFARLSLSGEILVEARPPMVMIGDIPVAIPPGAFLQAVVEAESALVERVLAGVGKAKKVADLFSGVGTFALRLAKSAEVRAVELEGPALTALDRAWRQTPGLKRITIEARDLTRRPMFAHELKGFDAVVFDPPRDGAAPQAKELAQSGVSTIVAVSCNPTTFARDARYLIDKGYRMGPVEPVDQFLFTHHVELVAVFRK
jgi:23S rRNA (uracil1939-C5)-methyltransferase